MREGYGALDTRRDVAREANVGTERFGRSFFYPSSDDEESCPMIGHDCIVRTFSRMPHPPGGLYETLRRAGTSLDRSITLRRGAKLDPVFRATLLAAELWHRFARSVVRRPGTRAGARR